MSAESLSATENSTTDSPGSANVDSRESADSLDNLLSGKTEEKSSNICGDLKCTLTEDCSYESGAAEKGSRSICCNVVSQCVWGVLLLVISIGGFLFTPQDLILKEKLNMRPGFPPYDWWADPPDEVKLRVYVFNITNHERFLAGLDEKIDVQEIGPLVYLEKLLHSNIHFNENSTMTYLAKRYPIFLPHLNHVNMNDTIIVPNMAVLGIASYLYDTNYIVRTGFRLLVNSHGSKMFSKKTIYEYLWEFTDPVLDTSKNIVPGLVPVNNMGVLARIYEDFTDKVTVKVGSQWGHKNFFQIDRFRGQPQLPGYDADECPDRIFGSTEGVMYHQHLKKEDVILYWRKTVCKIMPLYFTDEMVVDGVPVYRYNLSENVYDRVSNGTDCYDTKPTTLPKGLSDGSKCYYNFPMVISYPHFYTGDPPKDTYVTGLQPDRYKHNSYIIVEPVTGIPFRSVARMQSNLRIHDLSGFTYDYRKFSNLVIPLFWAEYNQEDLPTHIKTTIYFVTVILPPVSYILLTILLLMGSYFIAKNIYIYYLKNEILNSLLHFKSKNKTLKSNKILTYEKEAFLKITS